MGDSILSAFQKEVEERVVAQSRDEACCAASAAFMRVSTRPKYSYNFSWLGRPIIQYPQDIVAMQEVIWSVKPDVIVETGIAHGGSLILYASMLALLDVCEGRTMGRANGSDRLGRRVIGIDIEIRPANRAAVEAHPLSHYIDLVEGSSIDPSIVALVRKRTEGHRRVMVCLDSNHTHDHVLAELEAYAPLVTEGSYCVVFDTIVEDLPGEFFPDRPWGPGNSPKTAVHAYLQRHPEFVIDTGIQQKLLITVSPDGYLKRMPVV